MKTSLPKKLGVLLLFVLFANLFFLRPFGQSAFVLLSIGFLTFLLGIFVRSQTLPKFRMTLLVTGVFFALLCLNLLTRTSPFAIIIQGLGIVTTLFGLLYIFAVDIPFVRALLEIVLSPLLMLLGYLMGIVDGIVALVDSKASLSLSRSNRFMQISKSIGIGLVVSVPILFILLILLSSADPIFATAIKKYFSWFNLEKLSPRLIYSAVIFAILFPLLFIRKQLLNDEYTKAATRLRIFSFVNEFTVVMGLVAAVIGLFLLVQAPYIFVKVPFETDLSKFGVATYSEYVKKGFNELLFTALFIYTLIWGGLVMLRNKLQGSTKHPLFYIQLAVLAEFGIFLFSLFRRVFLYQSYHGWSLGRIYGSMLLLWICGITLFLLLRHFQKQRWVVYEALFTAAMFLVVGFFNAEDFIVKTHPPHVNKRTDYVYMSRMSADGYAGWKQAYAWAQNILTTNQEKPFLNKDDRRQTAYAGAIISQFLDNYIVLTQKYGTKSEQVEFYKILFESTLTKQKQLLVEVENKLKVQRDAEHASNPQLQLPEFGQGNTQLEIDYRELKTSTQKVEEALGLLRQSASEMKLPISVSISPYYPYNGPISACDLIQKSQALTVGTYRYRSFNSCANQLYALTNYPEALPTSESLLDSLMHWNATQFIVYKDMLTDIPLTQLITLQNSFFNQLNKIWLQPENERAFEVDISFDTPFLD